MTPAMHKKIEVDSCLPILKKAFPNNKELGYLLLGNWFTDVSQGIAPLDYAATMTDARWEGVKNAKKDSWFLRYLIPDFIIHWKVNQFVRQLLGDPPPKNSAMAKWFRNAVYVAGWVEFVYLKGPAKKLEQQGAGPITFEEYDRIYHGDKLGKTKQGRFTQYFPHEHFDRWPMNRTEKSDRKIYSYLEQHILNIAELLTLIERDWAKYAAKKGDEAKKRRHDLLAEFGYAMHTAEDYWAHTNFVDFAMRSINDIPSDDKLKRIHARRLLRDDIPRTKMFAEPGPTEPETHVVGGYFDGIDTRFSLVQLYKHVAKSLEAAFEQKTGQKFHTWKCGAQNCPGHKRRSHRCSSGVWFCRRFKPACPGHSSKDHSCKDEGGQVWKCGEEKCPGHSKKEHTCSKPGRWFCGRSDPPCPGHDDINEACTDPSLRLLDWREAKTKEERKNYKRGLALQQDKMQMPQKVRDAQMAFIELDWKMIDEWDGKCVSWVLEKMLKEGFEYGQKKFEDGSYYAERIGSHTLIAKDDETKQPGFDQAMNMAKRVDKYIMETMVGNTIKNMKIFFDAKSGAKAQLNLRNFVDWLHLLKHFMGNPDEVKEFTPKSGGSKTKWWIPAMKNGDGEHGHELQFISKEVADNMALLNTRKRLEMEHNSLIAIENARYEAERAKDGIDTKKTETLQKQADSKKYTHKDMDHGSIRLKCLKGELKVELSVAVWWTFRQITTAQVKAGNIWAGDFTEQSKVYDQDNRAVITAVTGDSQYEIMMVSYDR